MDLWENTETKKAIDIIARGARAWTGDQLTEMLRLARERKDPEFDAYSVKAEVRYIGRQDAVVRQALKKALPDTDVEKMPLAPISWLRLFARLDAGVYIVQPDRWLDDENGKRIPRDDPRSKLWDWALRKSRLHVQMAEAERRALITPGVSVGMIPWVKPPGDKVGFPRIDLYWPHNCDVLAHWSSPASWDHKYFVAFRQASPDASSSGEWYRVFSREPPEGATGEWGRWQTALVSTKGDHAADSADPASMVYEGERCPAFLVQLGEPTGHVFCFEDTDLIYQSDDLNIRRSNEAYVVMMQGHDQLWTNDPKGIGKQKVGPDAMLTVLNGSTVGVLSMNPKISDIRDSRDQALRELATARGNSPHAYVTKAGGPPQSGVAMRIENLTHDNRVADQAAIMQAIEEDDVLPILLDVVATFHPEGRMLRGCTPRMMPRKLPTFEEPRQRQERLVQAYDKKVITLARLAVEAELYPDLETAEAAIKAIADDGAPTESATAPTTAAEVPSVDAPAAVQDTPHADKLAADAQAPQPNMETKSVMME